MKLTLPLVALLALLLAACSKKAPSQLGELKGHHYENQHFAVSLDLPATWHIQSDEINEMIKESGRNAVVGDDRQKKAQMNAALKNTFTIFTLTEHEMGTPNVQNPLLMCMVERLTHAPGIKSADDYVAILVNVFKGSQTAIEVLDAGSRKTINGIEFTTLTTQMKNAGVNIEQKYHLLFKGGYVLAIASTYFDDATEAKLDEIMSGIKPP